MTCSPLSVLVSEKFKGNSWRVHPDWVYCEYNYAGEPAHEFDTPEDMLTHFVAKFNKPGWEWGTPRVRPLPQCTGSKQYNPNCQKCKWDVSTNHLVKVNH